MHQTEAEVYVKGFRVRNGDRTGQVGRGENLVGACKPKNGQLKIGGFCLEDCDTFYVSKSTEYSFILYDTYDTYTSM